MCNPGEVKGFLSFKSYYLMPFANVFINVMQLPESDLSLGTEPRGPRSDDKTFLVFTYIWQDDLAMIPKVPRAPRNINPAQK